MAEKITSSKRIHLLNEEALRAQAANLQMTPEDTGRVISLVRIYTAYLLHNNMARLSVRHSPTEMEDREVAEQGLLEAQNIWRKYTNEA